MDVRYAFKVCEIDPTMRYSNDGLPSFPLHIGIKKKKNLTKKILHLIKRRLHCAFFHFFTWIFRFIHLIFRFSPNEKMLTPFV